jgi:hypothetical protein
MENPFKSLNWNYNNEQYRNPKHHHVKVWLNFQHLMVQRKKQNQDLRDLVDSKVNTRLLDI